MFVPDVDTSITEAECALDTVRGTVSCKWKRDEGNVYVDAVVPCGSSAVLKINNKEIPMGFGEHHHTVSIQ